MDIVALSAFLSPCLPFLMKLGNKAAESAASKIGMDSWETAKKIWEKLHPKLEVKEGARVAAEQVAAKPDSRVWQGAFQEELEALLEENPDLAEAITQILQENPPKPAPGLVNQTVGNVEGQAIAQQTGGQSFGQIKDSKVVGEISGNVEGGVNL
jgi:hypothetical protein